MEKEEERWPISISEDDPKRPRNVVPGTGRDVDNLFAGEEQLRFFRDMFGKNVQIPQGAPTLETLTRDSDDVVVEPRVGGLYALPPDPERDENTSRTPIE